MKNGSVRQVVADCLAHQNHFIFDYLVFVCTRLPVGISFRCGCSVFISKEKDFLNKLKAVHRSERKFRLYRTSLEKSLKSAWTIVKQSGVSGSSIMLRKRWFYSRVY